MLNKNVSKLFAIVILLVIVLPFATAAEGHGNDAATHAAETASHAPDTLSMLLVVFLPFLVAAMVPFVYRFLGERTAYLGAATAATSFLLILSQYGTSGAITIPWIPALGVNLQFYVDGLAMLIGMLASGIGVLIFIYSAGYMHGESSLMKYYTSLLVFMGAMLGVAFAGDLIALFVFWELTSVASFMLIGHYQRSASSLYASRKSMIITVGGGLFMLIGFLLLQSVTGTFSLPQLLTDPGAVQTSLHSAGLYLPVLLLLAVGAAAKSAQVPLHIWLPNAMEAPTPVSAFLHSATMVKAGVYLIGRFRPLLVNNSEWMLLFVTLGLLTMTVAGMLAVASTDIKELLAYSTASHLGLIVAGFGFASGFGGETGAFHILNHALFKAPLFLIAGIIAHEAGTRTISELGGLRKDLPIAAAVTIVAGLGMAAIPPFNGFYSKELLFEASYEAAAHSGGLYWLLPATAVFGSMFTVLYSLKFIMLFFGNRPAALGEVHRPPLQMWVPPVLIAGIAAVVGLMPQLAIDGIVQSVVASVASGEAHAMHVGLPTHLTPAVAMSLITMAGGIGLYKFYNPIHNGLQTLFIVAPIVTANWWYDNLLYSLHTLSDVSMARLHNGLLRSYVSWTLATVSVFTILGYAATGAGGVLPTGIAITTALPIILILGVAVVGAFAVTSASSHISGVLTLSIFGFMVAVYYVLANAPDLALTQLVVETLSLVIFLLVLDKLPEFYGSESGLNVLKDTLLSALVGVTVAITVLFSTAGSPDKIAHYFVENAVSEGGGSNIVNVILVDFRAFDTLGEISVIAMASLSIVVLIGMRGYGRSHIREESEEMSMKDRLKKEVFNR